MTFAKLTVLLFTTAIVCLVSCAPHRPRPIETIRYGKDLIEQRIAVNGHVTFKGSGDGLCGEIKSPGNEDITLLPWPESRISHRSLNSEEIFRFEVLRETDRSTNSGYAYFHFLTVSKGDHLLYDASLCEVHRVKMLRQLEIADDGSSRTNRFFRNYRQFFPNDGRTYLLCGSWFDHPTWVCPSCVARSARERS